MLVSDIIISVDVSFGHRRTNIFSEVSAVQRKLLDTNLNFVVVVHDLSPLEKSRYYDRDDHICL